MEELAFTRPDTTQWDSEKALELVECGLDTATGLSSVTPFAFLRSLDAWLCGSSWIALAEVRASISRNGSCLDRQSAKT